MIRRSGERVQSGRRYRRRAGVYAAILGADGVLLTLQDAPVPEVQLPGGGIEPGEQPLAALHREVFEETGWSITVVRRLGAYRRFAFMPDYDFWAEKVCTVYLARPTMRLGPPSESGHTALWAAPKTAWRLVGNDGERDFLRSLA